MPAAAAGGAGVLTLVLAVLAALLVLVPRQVAAEKSKECESDEPLLSVWCCVSCMRGGGEIFFGSLSGFFLAGVGFGWIDCYRRFGGCERVRLGIRLGRGWMRTLVFFGRSLGYCEF